MRYFLDKVEDKLIAVNDEGSEARVIEELCMAKSDKDLDDAAEDIGDESSPVRVRILPEVLSTIKARLKADIPVAAIHDETGVSAPTIYKIKRSLSK